ncbi:cysteine--1-D-myo-inosityl 2-amino-2-deoxy-alpha-D-glucopyranoside ligase [Luteimicrobium xylanilyticum]|uniref:L-cysteine:1D-myo-inositol 2-amino-2-deoxy-alpha-D-glucopyranoside ligase n=1 Tax=Luteimicrobium xylanilyticum TaxID=1133546 RepID=A0A5P9Q9Q9_9MICO|nr:cysteine--1-D-myo-inosityl 2-amino-2-deoxy-alpha-D-glucopyranoside ligase [Luteimicrobium xylanilyticum]QFU98167.1 L-cysteine:1D-myo-inositol 2-amino-2-deoxy-alpha-D-glucopyranosideligase [Luteimicrobium xylanilyticum]
MHSWPAPQIPALPSRSDTGPDGPAEVRVHDSSTGELVVAAPGAHARMYVCGITPYDATHLGHAATYVAFDLLQRAWRDAGKKVTYASNVTDVDDPLLERASATGVDWRELAAAQTALFAEDMAALGVIPPDVYVGAVESVPDVVRAVSELVASGAAYRVPLEDEAGGDRPDLGDVYADLSVDDAFGAVSRLDRDAMLALFAERGGDPDRAGKRDALDPLLWRRERPGEPAWDGGDLGTGRPGWHIECALIGAHGLGPAFDVQGGGVDLLFPHHEMSSSHLRVLPDAVFDATGEDAAEAPAVESVPTDGRAARVNLHAALLAYEGEKMSKSRGNLVFVSTLRRAGVDPMAIRLAILAHHYRTPWEWTDHDLESAQARLDRWRAALAGNGGPSADATLADVRAAVADDLDAPRALAAVDAWADRALAPGADSEDGWDEGAPGVVARAVDALLGVRL